LSQDPSDEYTYIKYNNEELAHLFADNKVYAGFMGSLGDAGNTSEISSWYLKDDLSIIDEAIVKADESRLISDMETLETNPIDFFYLTLVGQYGSAISWESSNTDVVAEDGTVNPLLPGEGNKQVTLRATIKRGSAVRTTRSFTVIIKVADVDTVEADNNWLTNQGILGANEDLENIVSDLDLPGLGKYGSSISWVSNNPEVVKNDGKVTRPNYPADDIGVTLTAHIEMNG